jgi:hypothetical protein
MGLGELLSANFAALPAANSLGFSQAVFNLTQNVPYNFGLVTQLLNEIYAYNTFNTGSVRNVYSPNVCTATELMVDQLAGRDRPGPVSPPARFRARRPDEGRARQGRRRRQLGPHHGARHRAGHRHPQRIQVARRVPGRDRLPPRHCGAYGP